MGNTTSGYDESGHHAPTSYQGSSFSRRSSTASTNSFTTTNPTTRSSRSQTIGININSPGNLARQRRSSSLVGSLLSGGIKPSPVSKSFDYNGGINRKKTTRERQLTKEVHYRELVVKFDECVDGGYLAPYGVHDDETKLDYNETVVRQLIIDRKLQPFYIPLEDYDEEEISDAELLKILKSTLLHQPYPEQLEKFENLPGVAGLTNEQLNDPDNIDRYLDGSLSRNEKKIQTNLIFVARLYKRKSMWQQEENDRFIEAKSDGSANKMVASDQLLLDLYKNGDECPICFLYYPKNFNYSRCCQQPICTECFVQIKRKDPHYKNSHDADAIDENEDTSELLVSECASCPYCATPDFGVTYEPPILLKRTGLGSELYPSDYYRNANISTDAVSSAVKTRPRAQSLPMDHESVITSDMLRPDWEANLLKAKLKLKKRFAKANTIHMNNRLISNDEEKKIKKIEEEMLERAIKLSLEEQHR